MDPEQRDPQARRRHRYSRGRPQVPPHDHRRRCRTRAHRHLPRPRPRDAVLRAEELAAEDVLGARLFGLLPGDPGRSLGGSVDRTEAVQRPQTRRRSARPGAAIRQSASQCRCDATGLRPPQPTQAPSAWCAAQPEGRRTHHVGQGDGQEPRRHGARVDRPASDRPAEGGSPGSIEHRFHRPLRRGRQGLWNLGAVLRCAGIG